MKKFGGFKFREVLKEQTRGNKLVSSLNYKNYRDATLSLFYRNVPFVKNLARVPKARLLGVHQLAARYKNARKHFTFIVLGLMGRLRQGGLFWVEKEVVRRPWCYIGKLRVLSISY